jgi:putative nucleotidyltransferase with HDIG domain
MTSLGDRIVHFAPRRGIMATDAGRRVVSSVLLLTATAFAIAGVVLGLITIAADAAGLLPHESVGHLLLGMLGGMVAVVVAFLSLPVLGRLSRLGDDVRLLELCDPGAPLLREMMDEAPGTYEHSITAGTLAEAGANQVGADSLLARAGAYYHDIGKLARPRFFVENQTAVRNPHDSAPPEQSAMIITAHVREGVEMGQRARLPQPLVDIIDQHHGTSLVAYFYRKASAACDIVVDESGFRYEGHRPSTKEAGLVMLADAAEAAARACDPGGPAELEALVRRVVEGKVKDGQLADSGLSSDELEAVVRVYAKMLSGVRHPRVEYPGDPVERPERSDHAGESRLQPGS